MPDKHKDDKSSTPEVSRRESIKKMLKMPDGEELAMPECNAPHIVGYLFEIGPTMAAGAGEAPITHTEMRAWQENVGIELESWEARMLKRLSGDYLGESHIATKIDCKAPCKDAPYVHALARVAANHMKDAIRGLAKL